MRSTSYLRHIFCNLIRARPSLQHFCDTGGPRMDDGTLLVWSMVWSKQMSRPRHIQVRFHADATSHSLRHNNQLQISIKNFNTSYLGPLGQSLITLRIYHSPTSIFIRRVSRKNYDNFDSIMEREFKKSLDENLDYEDKNPKEILEKISRDQIRRQKAMRYNRIRRQFPQTKAPRLLTYDMMEQIRFLFQEYPEDWDVPRLAEGFSVTEDTIRKVLHSKFVPSEKRIAKMNNNALKNRSLLIDDARRVFVDTSKYLPERSPRFPAVKELKQESAEDEVRKPSTKYLDEGEKVPRKTLKTYKKSREKD
ncbi:uncharacterized protein LOC117110262 [Anneissia japonica]|uniref:uncharacterized protein LOC117110262 n=1 Tax=Anneissia japonica TaxID=1529436 RepID=UPI00142576E9|nr:uncharacterized protein LOC117110262 [Anneissia japonica]